MSQMGKYCKVYPVSFLQAFEGWTEKPQTNVEGAETIKGKVETGDAETDAVRCLYLQEDYTVTSGIFKDEAIIFDTLTPEWIDFCKNELKFEAPVYESAG